MTKVEDLEKEFADHLRGRRTELGLDALALAVNRLASPVDESREVEVEE